MRSNLNIDIILYLLLKYDELFDINEAFKVRSRSRSLAISNTKM